MKGAWEKWWLVFMTAVLSPLIPPLTAGEKCLPPD